MKVEVHQTDDRVLVVFASAAADLRYAAQMQELRAEREGAAERDLVVVGLRGQVGAGRDAFVSAAIGASAEGGPYGLGTSEGAFSLTLVSRDGAVLLRSAVPLTASEIFQVVDACDG